jgi:general nucleoside transport system permease protein
MAWAALPALGQVYLQLPILITSLLLNTPARALCSYLVKNYFADPTATSTTTVAVPEGSRIPTPELLRDASLSAVVVLAVVVVVSLRNTRAVSGYEGLVSGANLRFSRYGGVDVNRQTLRTMLAGGALAGTVGAHLVLGQAFRFVDGDLVGTGFAWTGLLVTLLAAHRAWPILAAGLFFAALQVGGLAMQRQAGVSWQLAQVLQAVVILSLAMQLVLVRRRRAVNLEGGPEGVAAAPVPAHRPEPAGADV